MTRRFLTAALVAASLGAPGLLNPAWGQIVNEEAVGQLTVGVGLGVLIPSMGDVNRNFDAVNQILQRHQLRSIKDVNAGVLTHLEVRYKFGQTPPEELGTEVSFLDRVSVGLAWGAINTERGFEAEQADVLYFTRTTTIYPHVLYHFPFTETIIPRLQVYAGGGPLLMRSAFIEWSVQDRTTNTPGFLVDGDLSEIAGRSRATADGVGLVLQAGSSFQLNKTFSLALDTGYRIAKLKDLFVYQAAGEASRFSSDGGNVIIRDPGIWSMVDFFRRDRDARYGDYRRGDPKFPDELDEIGGGCAGCRDPYYEGGDLEVDLSGPFATIALRVHFL